MTHDYCAETVRQRVQATFASLGVSPAELNRWDETLLVQDGRYYARSYRAGERFAMWLISAGFVQFYDAEGVLLQTLELAEEPAPQRRAA